MRCMVVFEVAAALATHLPVYHRRCCCGKPLLDRLVAELKADSLKFWDMEGDFTQLANQCDLLWYCSAGQILS